MASRLSGSLMRVLKHARIAWYRGIDGTTAYYEQPSPGIPGSVFVNGKCIGRLHVDYEGRYADRPGPDVQRLLTDRGINLDAGWMCMEEVDGLDLNTAIQQSTFWAARHQNGSVAVQCVDREYAVIFVDQIPRWRVKIKQAKSVFAEMNVAVPYGWYPLQQDLQRQRFLREKPD